MARDPLAVLWRLRDAAVAEASRELMAARARAVQQAGLLVAHQSQMWQEQSEAAGDEVRALAFWLPYAHLRTNELRRAVRDEEARVLRLQQALLGHRTAAEAVAKAMQRREVEVEQVQARREQSRMDEAGSRPTRAHGIDPALSGGVPGRF